jgi:hypothetical protein
MELDERPLTARPPGSSKISELKELDVSAPASDDKERPRRLGLGKERRAATTRGEGETGSWPVSGCGVASQQSAGGIVRRLTGALGSNSKLSLAVFLCRSP